MATIINMGDFDDMSKSSGKGGITNDFSFNNNVAKANISVRLGFLRKVYGLLSIQLFVTTATAALFMFTPSVKEYVQKSPGMLMVAAIGTFILLIALMVKSKEHPTNIILLFLFTFVEAYSIGVTVTFYDQLVVLEACVLTASVVFCLTLYTMQSAKDFSSWGAGLFSALWILIIALFLQLFFQIPMMELVISVGGAILFSCFIIYDTHLILHKLSPEEYILATINLYLDIINLFLYILRILSESRKN